MFALIASIAFTGAAFVGAFAFASTFQASRKRIADALQGRPLARV
jgi:hypothetical protein